MDMSNYKMIKQILGYLTILIIMFSCSDIIFVSEDSAIKILNTYVELDRFNNSFFLQLETNNTLLSTPIKEVIVELSFIGDTLFSYNKKFQLFDDGTNGDIIPFNGIFTLLTNADTISVPNIPSEIQDIKIDSTFKLHKVEKDSLDISVIILGKPFRVTSIVVDSLDNQIISVKNINIDNSYIELQINTDYMYLDNLDTELCDRSFNENPQKNAFESYFEWSNSMQSQTNPNHFLFSTKIPFNPVDECGGTGIAFLKFILHDLDTMSEVLAEEILLIIYGCGDGICELGYEDEYNCIEDCK
jgi:hypothetical protein